MHMLRVKRRATRIALLTLVLTLTAMPVSLVSQTNRRSGAWTGPILPAPDPFTLNGYDAVTAVAMIHRARLLQHWDFHTAPSIVAVRSVRAYFVGVDLDAFEGHQERYDVELNGEPIDWDHTYIEYDGDMINLRLLFTYRNQRPVPDVPYRLRYPR